MKRALLSCCLIWILIGCGSPAGSPSPVKTGEGPSNIAIDPDWQINLVTALPLERASLNLTCDAERSCWLWNRQQMWTTTGGTGWRVLQDFGPDQQDGIVNAFKLSSNTGWVIRAKGLYKTQDGGNTWSRIAVPRMDDHKGMMADLYFRDENIGWVVGGEYRALVSGEAAPNNALSDDRKQVLGGSVLMTTDGGVSWQPQELKKTTGRFERIIFSNNSGVVFGDAGGYATTDGGATWSDVLSRFRREDTGEVPPVLNAFFLDDVRAWLTLSGAELLVTEDGGKSWASVAESSPPETLGDLFFVDSKNGIALGTQHRVFKTRDGGRSWEEFQMNEEGRSLTVVRGAKSGLLLGSKNLYSVSYRRS